ncbi:MAG: ATP-dependent zinc metalloprotease FtsH [Clostridiales bacterium]|nr:ATP-dependent zinc metalloprotease FtsH [Clostridiales bacterium]
MLIAVISVILIGVIIWVVVYAATGVDEKTYSELTADINKGSVVEIYLENDTAYVKTAKSGKKVAYKVYSRYELVMDAVNDYYASFVDEEGKPTEHPIIDISFNDRYATSITDYIIPVLALILLVVLMVFMFRAMSNTTRSTMDFGKTKANMQNQLKVRFSDVAGAEEEKEELKEIVEFLKNPQKFTAVGARVPHGVLLVGPPGTGKTLFAKAVAGEANVPFFSKSGSDFVEMFVGVGASRVRDLFDQAKKNMPCIVFIDEIDAVGRQRGAGLGGGNDEREQTLNQLLVAMDGFESNEHIIVMAATNRSDVLDPALMRPGRFDRQIYVHLPDVRGREAIFKVHARNKPLASDVDFQTLARITSGFSGADIENMLNEAAILAAREDRTRISMEDMYEAIDKVEMGPQKKSRLVTPIDQRITAYHESGHAIVSCLTKGCDPVHEVTIIPRGQAGGYTMYRPDNDNSFISVSQLVGRLASIMGGRAAEELVIEDYTTGAVGDLQQATNIARKMVTEWGMSSKIGTVFHGGSQEVFLGRDYQSQHSYSEAVAAEIDAEIKRLIDEAHASAVKVLSENRKILDTMARVLIECETIYSEEVEMIINGATPEEVKKALNERLDRKAAHRDAMEKAPIKKLSDFQPVTAAEKPVIEPKADENKIVAEQKDEIKQSAEQTEEPKAETPVEHKDEPKVETPVEQKDEPAPSEEPVKKVPRKRSTKKDDNNGDNA